MNHNAFGETIINTIKFDSNFKKNKALLLPMFRRSSYNFIPQYQFASRPGQHYENIEIRVPVPIIDEANEQINEIKRIIGYVYEESEEYALGDVLIRPQVFSGENDNIIEHDVVFTEIQETIIQGIRDAKYLIWVAVAWFSNDVVLSELLEKKKQGLNIRLIISDEPSNQRLIPEIEKAFDFVIIPHRGWNEYNRMHDKFCIIDMEYVMHGSYNWTKTANFNDETLATALDSDFVKKFADEFMRMYLENR